MKSHSFNTSRLNYDQIIKLLRLAHSECDKWQAEILDCRLSMHRKRIEMSFEDILSKFRPGDHFSVIHRNSSGDNYIEIGFRADTSDPNVDYFLYLFLPVKYISIWATRIDDSVSD